MSVLRKNIKKEFAKSKSRHAVMLISISIGLLAIMFMVSIGGAVQKSFNWNIFNEDKLRIIEGTKSNGYEDAISKMEENIQSLGKINNAEETLVYGPLESLKDTVTYNGQVINIVAVDEGFLKGAVGTTYEKGKSYVSDNFPSLQNNNEVSVDFGKEKLKFPINGDIKIKRPSLMEHVSMDIDKNYLPIIFITYDKYFELKDKGLFTKVNFYMVKMRDKTDVSAVANQMIGDKFFVSSDWMNYEKTNKVFGIIKSILGLLGGLALVIALFTIINTINIILNESKRDIAILKAIGCKVKDIKKEFINEIFTLFNYSFLIGLILNFGFGRIINIIFDKQINMGNFTIKLPIIPDLKSMIFIYIIPLAITLIVCNKVLKNLIKKSVVESLKED